jgi:hypothetical protein
VPSSRTTAFGYKTSRLIPRSRRVHNAHVKRQRLKQIERQDAINKRNNKRARNPKKDGKQTKMIVGDMIICEIVNTHTMVDVLWQDGLKSENVPAVQLQFADSDLDDHVFLAGL